jgi:hypothetical protein
MSESVQVRPFFDLHRRKFGHEASQKELSAVSAAACGRFSGEPDGIAGAAPGRRFSGVRNQSTATR